MIRAYAAVSDAAGEPVNEDAWLALPKRHLYGVADGYGGNGIGDKAAKKALEDVKYFVEHGLGDSEVTLPFIYRSYYTAGANLIFNAFLYANKNLVKENEKFNINARGGCSTLFTFFEKRHMTLASAGNCQAILLREGVSKPLLTPRSFQQVRGSPEWNPKWAFPLAGFGHAMDFEPEIIELKIQPNDILLLLTDGVYPQLKPEDFSRLESRIQQTVTNSEALDRVLAEENQQLVSRSLELGNKDGKALILLSCL